MVKKSSFLPLFLPFVLSLTGCAVVNMHGHEVDPVQLEKIKVGTTTKQQVAELLGTPSSLSTFSDQSWYYMSETRQRRAFLNPTVLKSNVTIIKFDNQGRVQCLDSLTEKDKQVIAHVHRATPTAGHSFGVLEQLFGNVGRFNGKDPDE